MLSACVTAPTPKPDTHAPLRASSTLSEATWLVELPKVLVRSACFGTSAPSARSDNLMPLAFRHEEQYVLR